MMYCHEHVSSVNLCAKQWRGKLDNWGGGGGGLCSHIRVLHY